MTWQNAQVVGWGDRRGRCGRSWGRGGGRGLVGLEIGVDVLVVVVVENEGLAPRKTPQTLADCSYHEID
jgi:hypothetical protein